MGNRPLLDAGMHPTPQSREEPVNSFANITAYLLGL